MIHVLHNQTNNNKIMPFNLQVQKANKIQNQFLGNDLTMYYTEEKSDCIKVNIHIRERFD